MEKESQRSMGNIRDKRGLLLFVDDSVISRLKEYLEESYNGEEHNSKNILIIMNYTKIQVLYNQGASNLTKQLLN